MLIVFQHIFLPIPFSSSSLIPASLLSAKRYWFFISVIGPLSILFITPTSFVSNVKRNGIYTHVLNDAGYCLGVRVCFPHHSWRCKYLHLLGMRRTIKKSSVVVDPLEFRGRKIKSDNKQRALEIFLVSSVSSHLMSRPFTRNLSNWTHVQPQLFSKLWCLPWFHSHNDLLPTGLLRWNLSSAGLISPQRILVIACWLTKGQPDS